MRRRTAHTCGLEKAVVVAVRVNEHGRKNEGDQQMQRVVPHDLPNHVLVGGLNAGVSLRSRGGSINTRRLPGGQTTQRTVDSGFAGWPGATGTKNVGRPRLVGHPWAYRLSVKLGRGALPYGQDWRPPSLHTASAHPCTSATGK